MAWDDNDRPFGPFKSAGTKTFRNASIEASIVEVRLAAGRNELIDEDAVVMLAAFEKHDAFRMEASVQNQVQFMINAAVGMAESTQSVVARGWQFSTDDRSCVFNVTPQAASVQVSRYARWSESMLPQLTTLLEVARDVCGARVIERTGMRYINRFPPPADNGPWTDVVSVATAGLLGEPSLGSMISNAHQQLELSLEQGIGAVIRHGPLPGNSTGYLMDIDVYDTVARELIPENVLGRAQRLNRTAFAMLCHLLSPLQLEEMDPLTRETQGEQE
jgi:uncharacterized protein (TIGR04255 family)